MEVDYDSLFSEQLTWEEEVSLQAAENADWEMNHPGSSGSAGPSNPSRFGLYAYSHPSQTDVFSTSALSPPSAPGVDSHPTTQTAPPDYPSPPPPVVKRSRGRPKGSRNRVAAVESTGSGVSQPDQPKRLPGRPLGTGHQQKQRALLGLEGIVKQKRPVGRPRKSDSLEPAASQYSIEFGKVRVPGTRSFLTGSSSFPQGIQTLFNPPATPTPPIRDNTPRPGAGTLPTANELAPTPHLENSEAQAQASLTISEPVIPDEDPQRDADGLEGVPGQWDDEDGERDLDAAGDGLGDEDDGPDEGDEGEDEDEDATEEMRGARSRKRRPQPQWLLDAFRERLAEASERDSHGLPKLYATNQSFWFPQPSTYFLLLQPRLSPSLLYNPRFFLWDPAALCPGGIPCPTCHRRLYRHAHISRPRRCVDSGSSFWIIGYRYRCPGCLHPKSGKHNVTFRSWDSRILAVLPPSLALEFPAMLSHRSGISRPLFSHMRSCFQNGMGPKQFSDALYTQHFERHDTLRLQYIRYLAARKIIDGFLERKYLLFPVFTDDSIDGPRGYVPSGSWLRNTYDNFIEAHASVLNQHTAMLSADICGIDHSHKFPKHIARVGGEPVFTGLLTIMNEVGEIRSCSLVGTKSHSQYAVAITRMRESLQLYGHSQPRLFYTDNMADEQFLLANFSSLRQDVVPIDKYSHLEAFTVPDTIHILAKSTVTSINDAMSTILDDLSEIDHDHQIFIGFDSEWNVEISGQGRVVHRGSTAIVQIAYEDRIYILQVSDMLAAKKLPHKLRLLLSHPHIIKVGRMVNADLKHLETASQSALPFIGGLDLARLAKDRQCVTEARCGLAELSAQVLGKNLRKAVPERISSEWENNILSREQLLYAAGDAFASLQIYNVLAKFDIPQKLPIILEPMTPVLLYSSDNTTLIARGHLSPLLASPSFDNINITPTRTVICVTEVQVPGALVTTHRKQPLNSFGRPPFAVVCLRSHLRTCLPPSNTSIPPYIDPSTSSTFISPTSNATPFLQTEVDAVESMSMPSDNTETPSRDDGPSIGDLIFGAVEDAALPSLSNPSHEVDEASATLGLQTLGLDPTVWDTTIHSRVLKDPFHVFNMFYISRRHGLRVEFARELRNAMFIDDKVDKARINAWAESQNPKTSFEQLCRTSPAWVRRRCKRVIPPPHILYLLISQVFRIYGPLKDSITGAPLFNAEAWRTAKNILDLVYHGHLSDPPGIPLYIVLGMDSKCGLPIYRCSRGTNYTEGGVHTHLRSHLPTSGASVRHVHSRLLDFVLRHNLLVGTYNRTGRRYRGHFSIWVTNEIQENLVYLADHLVNPGQVTGWVNGNLYVQTTESIGIIPIPETMRIASGMADFQSSTSQKQKHGFLARMQGTRKPVLPVHSIPERSLFRQLMIHNIEFNRSNGPNWKQAVKVWNQHADTADNIFYKLSEQLKVYFTQWKENLHIKETLTTTSEVRKPLALTLRDQSRSERAPPVPERSLQPHVVVSGLLPPPPTSQIPNSLSSQPPPTLHGPHALPSGDHDMSSTSAPPPQTQDWQTQLAQARVVQQMGYQRPTQTTRKRRTCRKCNIESCSGSQKVQNCRNTCRDCGQVQCRGRNSKRVHLSCNEGWN